MVVLNVLRSLASSDRAPPGVLNCSTSESPACPLGPLRFSVAAATNPRRVSGLVWEAATWVTLSCSSNQPLTVLETDGRLPLKPGSSLLVSRWVARLDVGVFTGFAVEAAVAGTFVAAVEVLWLLLRDHDGRHNAHQQHMLQPHAKNPVETAE